MQATVAMYFAKVQSIVPMHVRTIVVFSISSEFSDEKISIQRVAASIE